jgi:hypothetical protein
MALSRRRASFQPRERKRAGFVDARKAGDRTTRSAAIAGEKEVGAEPGRQSALKRQTS